jgi:hypothetical protein
MKAESICDVAVSLLVFVCLSRPRHVLNSCRWYVECTNVGNGKQQLEYLLDALSLDSIGTITRKEETT